MKNISQERDQFSQSKPFSINFNLTFFVVCLIVFSCVVAIVVTFFSSFPENLMILTLKLCANSSNYFPLPVPMTTNDHPNNNGSETKKRSYTQREFAHYMDHNDMTKPALASRTRDYDPLERVVPNVGWPVSGYVQVNFAHLDDKESTAKAAMLLKTRDEPLEKVPNADSQTKKSTSCYTRADFVHDKELMTNGALENGDFLHDMDDDELKMKAATASRTPNDPLQMVPKVAFMFLVKGPMHLVPLWERFFKGNQGMFSIYVHSPPSYTATFPEDSVFHGRRIPSKEVRWGKFNMVEAERRLLASALLDTSNQRFVLLSESCIPLFNFSTVYSYLIDSQETFVEAYDKPGPVGRKRYSHQMLPVVSISQWRKGSQWFQIDRFLALEVVLDDKYFCVFKRHCKGSCYGDEHYLPTLVNIEFGERNSNRTLTWVDWSRGGPHPGRFERPQVTDGFLETLRSKRDCVYNGRGGNICFLFARKFPPSSVSRLILFAAKVLEIQ